MTVARPRQARARALLTLGAALLCASSASAFERPSAGAATAETVTLPSGPGSIRGLADSPSVSAFRGQVTYSVPIALPAGPTGFAPSLSLEYDGGLGNGPLGIGWQMEVPRIVRSTRHGVPVYVDPGDADGGRVDEFELLGLDGGGRLVSPPGGQWRVEGSGQRVRVWRTAGGFDVRLPNGSLYVFDRPFGPEGAETPGSGVRPFGWLLTRATSIHGHEYACEWTIDGGVPYLVSLHWGPETGGIRRYRAQLDYESRSDAVVSYRRGYREVNRLRLVGVTVTVAGGGEPQRLRRYMLDYDAGGATPHGQPGVALSRLTGVRMSGTDGTTEAPPLTFEYGGTWAPRLIEPEDTFGWTLEQRGTTLADIDGDGVLDLARFDLGERTWKPGRIDRFGPTAPLPGGGLRHLSDLRFMDLTGDGVAEVLSVVSDEWQVLRVMPADPASVLPDERVPHYADAGRWPGTQGVPLNHPDYAFADVDGDSRTDVLWGRAGGLAVAFMRDAGLERFSDLGPIAPNEPVIALGDPRTAVHEWNGDGLADVVFWGNSRLHVCFGRGDGTFAPPVRFEYPWGDGNFDLDAVRLADLNRDGLIDLVRIGSSNVFAWLGRPTGFPKDPTATVRKPKEVHYDDVVTLADLNANGSTDLVFSGGGRIHGIDFVGVTTPGLLTTVWNGLGARHRFDWASSAEMMVEAAEWHEPWTERLPMAMPVPWRTTVHTGHAGDPDRITVYRVRDGFWDTDERVFGGFLGARTVTVAGTGNAQEERIIDTAFESGRGASRVLRGQPIWERTTDGDGKLYAETVTLWDALPVEGLPAGDARLRVARAVETRTLVFEGQPTPLRTRTTITHDALGQPIREVKYGREDLDGDEVVTDRSYASNETTGVQGVVCAERLQELDGTVRRYSRTHYDSRPTLASVQGCDPDGESLCACTVTTGLVVATDAWLGPIDLPETAPETGRWVRQSETDYGDFALPTRQRSGGVERTFTYDADLLHPLTETVDGPSDLTWSATWNETLDLIASVSDPTGLETALTYDALGRVIARIGPLPDGTPDVLEEYEYVTDPITSAGGPGPHVIARRHEYGAADDGLSVTAVNGLGEPRYTVTFTGTTGTTAGPWLVSGYRERNRLGLTTRLVSPYATNVDPREAAAPAPPEGHPSQRLVYDAQRRVIEHHLPPTPSLPDGVTQIASIGRFTVSTGQTWTYQGPTGAPVAMSGAVSTVESDGLGRAIRATRLVTGAPEETEVQETVYDAAGAILTEDLQEGRVVRTFVTDSLGRLRRASDPDSGVRLWTWDDDRRLVASENGESDRIEYGYDSAARLTSRRLLSATLEELSTFRYDTPLSGCSAGEGGGLGRLLGVTLDLVESGTPTERLETTCWSFGPDGRQFRSTRDLLGKTLSTESTFSPSGLVLASTLADDDTDRLALSQSFDAATRLLRVDVQRPGLDEDPVLLWAATGYDENGALRGEQLGSGAGTAYERDALGLVTRVRVGDAMALTPVVGAGASPGAAADLEAALWDLPPPAVRLDLGVRYDGIGAPVDVTDFASSTGLDQTARYAYDPAGRLVGAALGSGPSPLTFTYSYDALQNLTSRTASTSVSGLVARLGTYTYGGTAHPRRLVSAAGLTLGYDDAGRTTSYADWDQRFDADDRIRSVVRTGLDPLSYQYGADGERIASWEDDVLTERRFGPSLLHRPVEGELQLYLQVGDRPVARIDLPDEVPSTAGPVEVRYLNKGVSAGPVLVTGADASLLEERIYEPYGPLLATEGPGGDEPYGWLNKPVDPNTLWTDHGARWYSPEIARWLSSDPLSWAAPMEQLPFAYVGGAPTLLWDPDGRSLTDHGGDHLPPTAKDIGEAYVAGFSTATQVVGKAIWGVTYGPIVDGAKKMYEGGAQAVQGAVNTAAEGGFAPDWTSRAESSQRSNRQISTGIAKFESGAAEVAITAATHLVALDETMSVGQSLATADDLASKGAANVAKRPSGFRKHTVQNAWDDAASGSQAGTKACPTCGKDVKVAPGQGRRDWDVDHQPPWSKRDHTDMTRKEVLDDYNTGTRLECPGCNRSRGGDPAP